MRYRMCLAAVLMSVSFMQAAEWPHWRGPFYNGTTLEKGLPVNWSQTENVVWRIELKGASAGSPVIWQERVFLSGVDQDRDMLVAQCFDRSNGSLLWQQDIAPGVSQDSRSTRAAASPVTDGKQVVFSYATGDLVCFDLAGQKQWARNLHKDYGPYAFQWTFSSSPLLYDGILYFQVLQRDVPVRGRGLTDQKNESYILAMKPDTGDTLWRQIRPSQAVAESREGFTSPLPFEVNGTMQLVVVGGDDVTGHDLKTGKELWRWGTWNPNRIGHWRLVPSAVVGDNTVLVCAPKGDPVYGIRPSGTGVLPDSAVAWTSEANKTEVSADVPTPAFYDGDFFILNDLRRHLSRVNPRTGQVKWSVEVPGRAKYEASPLVADDRIYLINHAGGVVIMDAGNGQVLKEITMDDPQGREVVRASIVAAHGQLFIRTTRHLFCVGKRQD
ncbi:MAG: PQQ-binding-like beta-propeller repeat protein [Phycisphaerae bacterium]|nr:PQQ-binding-like beta-propeller repeat protein [Phycisphaerae bacterium]